MVQAEIQVQSDSNNSNTNAVSENVEVQENRPSNTIIDVQAEDTKQEETQQNQKQEEEEVKSKEQQIAETIETREKLEEDVKNDLAERGVNFDEIADEYYNKGQLSEATMEQLEKAGYPESLVNNYIRGLELEAEQFANTVFNYVGGKEQFKQLTDFVQANLDANYINAFNATIMNGNLTQIKLLLDGVQAQMQGKYGVQGRSLSGNATRTQNTNNLGFNSVREMTEAMKDPRYGRDKEYTHAVEQKVKLSNLF